MTAPHEKTPEPMDVETIVTTCAPHAPHAVLLVTAMRDGAHWPHDAGWWANKWRLDALEFDEGAERWAAQAFLNASAAWWLAKIEETDGAERARVCAEYCARKMLHALGASTREAIE